MRVVEYQTRNGELVPVILKEYENRDSSGMFKRGHMPWNKGKKGLDIGGEQTQFKPGHEPHNTKYDGCISKRWHKGNDSEYLYIRISKGNWKLYHRYVYEQHNGPIPKGCLIRFRDGNTLNCSIENLYLVTRAEHARRNHNSGKAGRTLKKTYAAERMRRDYGIARKTKLRIK